jgi:hypothetical protein
MNCPFLVGQTIKQCRGVSAAVVLSGCELTTYCQNGEFKSCPVFQACQKRKGEELSLNDYCVIYSAWARMKKKEDWESII